MSAFDVFRAAGDTYADLVARIEPGWYDRPGLGVWDVRSLVGHGARAAITVADYLERPAQTEDLRSSLDYYLAVTGLDVDDAGVADRGRAAGAALGDDPATAVRAQLDRALQAVAVASPDTLITCIVGGIRVASYLPTRTFELVVHGLDVARATGLGVDFPDPCISESLALAAQVAVSTGKGTELLLAVTGRDRLGEGFSVVR